MLVSVSQRASEWAKLAPNEGNKRVTNYRGVGGACLRVAGGVDTASILPWFMPRLQHRTKRCDMLQCRSVLKCAWDIVCGRTVDWWSQKGMAILVCGQMWCQSIVVVAPVMGHWLGIKRMVQMQKDLISVLPYGMCRGNSLWGDCIDRHSQVSCARLSTYIHHLQILCWRSGAEHINWKHLQKKKGQRIGAQLKHWVGHKHLV